MNTTNTNTDLKPCSSTHPDREARLPSTRLRGFVSTRRVRRGHRSLRTLAGSLALASAVTLIAPPVVDAATSWNYVEKDSVSEEAYSLKLWGSVTYGKASHNKNYRAVWWNIGALQRKSPYRALCVGTKIMFRTEHVQHTVGGSVTAGWSMTGGLSGSGTGTYSRTKLGGTTSDGYVWKCPKNNSDYQRQFPNGALSFHPTMEGKLTHVAFIACLSDDPNNPNRRWCTPWDVNAYGGR